MAVETFISSTPKLGFIQERAPAVQIEQIYPSDIKDLASKYWSNRRIIDGIDISRMTGIETKILGIMEIQGDFLKMLGQEHILEEKTRKDFRIAHIKQVTTDDLYLLLNQYRNLRRIYEQRDLERLIWTTLLATPMEVKLEGNMDELNFILFWLGQGQAVLDIDREAREIKDNALAA